MNDIYLDLISENIEDVKIIGVGKDQYISSLDGMINSRVLPWVQDSSSNNYEVWSNFEANQRDIFFINIDGQIDTSFNITPYNPSNPDDVTYIKELILSFRGSDNSSLSSKVELTPESFTLYQNYPNPFNPSTEISFSMDVASDVNLTIYNMLGQKVKVLENALLAAGTHSYTWNGQDELGQKVSTGVYLYTLSDGTQTISKKMALMK